MRESETLFKTVFMMVADAFYIATLEEGVILEINNAFEDLFGYSHEDAVGRTSKDLDIWVDYADRIAMRDGVRQNGFVRQMETRGRKKNGECFDCSTSASVVTVDGTPCVVGVIRDITGRKHAEQMLLESRQALADSEESLLALMDSTNDLIWTVDPVRFGLVRFNRALHQYFAREGIACRVGMDPAELQLPPAYAARWHERYTRALREGPFVEEYIPFPGRPVLLVSLNLVKTGDEVVAISVFAKDITERKEAENALREGQERLRDLSGRLIAAQEAERSRLARDLHDDFCQRLALLSIHLDLLVQAPPPSAAALHDDIAGLRRQVDGLAGELRRMSHDLHPAKLEHLGLASALRALCVDLNKTGRLVIHCEARSVPRDLPMPIALCLYRVAQESLQNVIKHSRAATARVDLTTADDAVVLVVTDDGCGFDVAAAQEQATLGLANMRERVRLVSGFLAIDCPAGGGTRVEARVPRRRRRAT